MALLPEMFHAAPLHPEPTATPERSGADTLGQFWLDQKQPADKYTPAERAAIEEFRARDVVGASITKTAEAAGNNVDDALFVMVRMEADYFDKQRRATMTPGEIQKEERNAQREAKDASASVVKGQVKETYDIYYAACQARKAAIEHARTEWHMALEKKRLALDEWSRYVLQLKHNYENLRTSLPPAAPHTIS